MLVLFKINFHIKYFFGRPAGKPDDLFVGWVLEKLTLKPTQPPTVVGFGMRLSLAINDTHD